MQKSGSTKKLVQTALLVAIAVALRNFSYMVPFGGQSGMRIGVSGFFSKLPALLFGPVYGGLSSALTDLMGFLLKPEGGYLPLLTLTALLGGILTGLLWRWVKPASYRRLRMGFLALFGAAALLGVGNHIALAMQTGGWYQFLQSFGKKAYLVAFAPYAAAALGFAALGLDALASRFSKHDLTGTFLKLLVVFGIADIAVTTVNTAILMIFTPSIGALGFTAFYLPRLAQEVIMVVLSAYVSSLLLELYNRAVRPHIG